MKLSLLFFSFLVSAGGARAEQSLGVLQLDDLTLRPQGVFKEGKEGEFQLGESSLGVSWQLDQTLSSYFRFGAADLRGKPKIYSQTNTSTDIDLLEAYGQFDGLLGTVKMGLIPLQVSRDGLLRESELIFPRGQVFSRGILGLRDLGINYFISHNRFFTSMTAHNGESGSNSDNKTWYSARWGYDFRKLRLEAFGQTGSTTPQSTSTSTLDVARFNPNQDAKWRMGGFYVDWIPSRFRMSLEAMAGDVTQNKETHRFLTGHFDMGQIGESGFGWFFRYNPFDPDTRTDNDAQHNLSLALVMANSPKTSKLILVGTKVLEEGRSKIPNDEIRLVWSTTPLFYSPSY